jgi:tRNA1(Val) A37 N6-methylase TrmN6
MTADPVTEDRFYGGRLVLRQSAHGYRAGADALLLAAAVTGAETLMEAGCGPGAALMAVALRHPGARLAGVERDPAAAALARENVRANGLQGRIAIVESDLFAPDGESFGGVFCNPPFAEAGEGRLPAAARQGARVTEHSLDAWIARLSNRLAGGGALTLIHRADRIAAILAALDGRLGGAAVYPVRPRADAPAHRVLVRAVKGSRAPATLLKGLDLHAGEAFTPEADAIFRGEASIDW